MNGSLRRFLVTGAAGSVGSALTSRLLYEGHTVCAFDHHEDGLFKLDQYLSSHLPLEFYSNARFFLGDIRSPSRLLTAFQNVDTVIHCAALKHVGIGEYNPYEDVETNIIGTQNVINACQAAGVSRALLASSDKSVNPTSLMGATKLVAERLFTTANTSFGDSPCLFSTVRFGNVWNTNGSLSTIFKRQVDTSAPITLTHESMTRFFIDLDTSVRLLLKSVDIMLGGEIFVLNMGAALISDISQKFLKRNAACSVIHTGIKPGEKLYEELFTEQEAIRTVLDNDIFVILPEESSSFPRFASLYSTYSHLPRFSSALRSDDPSLHTLDLDYFVNSLFEPS